MFNSKINGFVEVLFVVAIAAIVGLVSVYVSKSSDGVVEEVSEDVIEQQLSLPKGTVDLTPSTKE